MCRAGRVTVSLARQAGHSQARQGRKHPPGRATGKTEQKRGRDRASWQRDMHLVAGEGEDLEAVLAVPLVQAVQPLVIRLCRAREGAGVFGSGQGRAGSGGGRRGALVSWAGSNAAWAGRLRCWGPSPASARQSGQPSKSSLPRSEPSPAQPSPASSHPPSAHLCSRIATPR